LPSSGNITTAAGDEAEFIEYAAGKYRCTNYTKADGTPIAIGDETIDSDAYVDASIDFAHIQDVAANSVLGRDANSSGVLSEVALATTEILIGDGTGFTAASLSGDVTMANTGAVTIANDSIDSQHYAAGSIDNEHLADDAVDTDEIADNAVTLAKMAGGTDGNIISFDASGDPVAVATGTDGQVLTSAGAGAPPAFEDAAGGGGGGGLSEYDIWALTTNFDGTGGEITANLARSTVTGFEEIGTGMTESSGIFTFPSTGYWEIVFHSMGESSALGSRIYITEDDSSYSYVSYTYLNGVTTGSSVNSTMFKVTSTSTHKVMFRADAYGISEYVYGSSANNRTYMVFKKVGDI